MNYKITHHDVVKIAYEITNYTHINTDALY